MRQNNPFQTIRKHISKKDYHYFDLENPRDLAKLDNPLLALENLEGLVIIDEIQRRPELFPVLRGLIDQSHKTKFLILGSASRDLIQQGSETLAGRISYLELGGLNLENVKGKTQQLWSRGGFPRSFLAKTEIDSYLWREDYITTFLERDVPNLGIHIPPKTLRRFWMMLAHYHGQIFNASEIARSMSLSDHTAKKYLDILTGTFLIRQVHPWFNNTKKRLVKSPKIFFRDTGLFHSLLSLKSYKDLTFHPKLGASWEGFVLEQAIQILNLKEEAVFFWAQHGGAEINLYFQKDGKNLGIEVKYTDAPKLTKSMYTVLEELDLTHLWIIYPGKESYPLHKKVTVLSLDQLHKITT